MHKDRATGTENVIDQYGLIGNPLTHSFSKNYFTNKFLNEGITGSAYELYPLDSIEELPALLASVPNLRGLNVTIPYKQQVLPYLDDSGALPLPACNCIRISEGKLQGFNTDVAGFEISFREKLLPQHSQALILGTGGASVAVQYVLGQLKIPFKLVSRNSAAGISYDQLDEVTMTSHSIIINTTPVGTYPNSAECPAIPYTFIGPGHYCYDLVYNPAKTLFLARAEANGANIKNGSDMLRIQAEESWKIWREKSY